ncbi:hypothetical protein H3Z83_05855 [Tenacibaculum sp. S7007]|uniref:Uncharacterized protein n=2 Tax=Tenacibaculum pelagium TaxID=2759527 RepID=A0A839ALR2_9FLAO|nr:hypothetical protein [Tenacibaculum pelagium]
MTKICYSQDINLFIKDIKEERHLEQEDSFIELTSIIKGIKVNNLNQVKIKEITTAVDDNGNILKKMESFFGDDYSSSNQLKIKLEAPSRKSSKISSLEGVIKYFSPSESNGSKIIITNLLDNYNKNLLRKKHSDIKLTLIDKEALQKLKEEDEKEYNKQIEKLKKEGGLGEELAETVGAFKQFFEGFSNFGSKESLSFYIEDKKDEIVEIFIYNGEGKKMNYGSSRMGKNKLTINLREKVASNWKIEVLIENEKSLKEYKFNLINIILP